MSKNYIKVSNQVSYKEVRNNEENSIFHIPVTDVEDKL